MQFSRYASALVPLAAISHNESAILPADDRAEYFN